MFPLQAITPEALHRAYPSVPIADARKVVGAVHRDEFHYRPSSRIPRTTVEVLTRESYIPRVTITHMAHSALDPFVKLVLRGIDEHGFECVRIPLEKPGRFSACVSSQAGCALGCTFCATGRMGLIRNLETWEIVEQVREIRRTLTPQTTERVHGVVFQGMGEPMANLDRVLAAIEVLCEPAALAIDMRNITVCTSGLPAGIERLARAAPRVRLGISIGSARPEVRSVLMPIDRVHSLDSVLDAAVEHAKLTGMSPMWAVTLLSEVNDHEQDAVALAHRAQDFARRSGHRPRISVIPYNALGENDPFVRSVSERETRFRDVLHAQGVGSHLRYSGGSDVAAACGQLVTAPPRSGRLAVIRAPS